MRAKVAQERLIKAGGVPYTILRATQFFEFHGAIAEPGADTARVLGAERMVPAAGRRHLYSLWDESQKVGRELTRDFYQRYADMRQNAFAELARDNADAPRGEVLSATQKLLDRVLFCAFCEDRGLLPTETIRKAYEHRDPYRPHTIWDNFRALFDSINRGNAALGIHAYNGGLFAPTRCSTASAYRTPSALTFATWAVTTIARPRRPPNRPPAAA